MRESLDLRVDDAYSRLRRDWSKAHALFWFSKEGLQHEQITYDTPTDPKKELEQRLECFRNEVLQHASFHQL